MRLKAFPHTALPSFRVLCGCFFFLLAMFLSGCKTELFSKVSEADANAVLGALYAEGISASKISVGENSWKVEVEEGDHQRALQVTQSQGIPREKFSSMGELFKKEGLVSTPSEIRMRYIFALSQELSTTLSSIDGVVSARVHPVIPVNDPLSDKVLPASAAVFIKHLPDADLQQMAPAIKSLVTRSIEGLKPENVSLTFFATRAPAPVSNVPTPSSFFGEPLVASAVLCLTALLALTWGVLGWRMWRRQQKASAPSRDSSRMNSRAVAVKQAGASSGDGWMRWEDGRGSGNSPRRDKTSQGDSASKDVFAGDFVDTEVRTAEAGVGTQRN